MTLIADGRSEYQIVTPGRGFPVEERAALDLQDALFRMTGVRLPVRWGDRVIPPNPRILVGQRDADQPGLWDRDRYRIEPSGRDLLLAGAFRRGTHYAVHAFLESLGVRYFAPGAVHYPRRKVVRMPRKAVTSESAFAYRHVFYPTAQEPEWALRWKLNVHSGADRRWGPNASAHSFGHSFASLVPTRRYFDEHPEYFSLVDGYRRRERPQLCGTNPATAEAACETMARWIEQNPDRRIFAVGQNDWDNWCECPDCAAVDAREGGPTGQLLTLVNRVAERFPDRIIATLSYAWSLEPPAQVHARDNVLIVLCHNQGCFTHPLDGCDLNAQFLDRLRRWKQRAEHILIWDYYVDYYQYLLTTPNFHRIGQDIRTYRDIGVDGMFCQGSACRGGQFEHLRQYLQSRLLWQPDQDVSALMREWARGVYGPAAAGPILEYLDLLQQRVDAGVHMPRFGMSRIDELYTPEVLERSRQLWDQAEASADTREHGRRVFAERSTEMLARLLHRDHEYRLEGDVLRLHPPVDAALRDRFVEAALAHDAPFLREDVGAPESFGRLFGRDWPAVVLQSDALQAVVVPEMGGRTYSLTRKQDGLALLAVPSMHQSVHSAPFSDGYDFSVQARRLGPGAVEEYTVQARSPQAATIQADLDAGLQVRTEYRLAGAELTAEHTVTNTGQAPVELTPMVNPAWSLAALGQDAVLELRDGQGQWSAQPINPDRRPAREVPFAGPARPAGGWRLVSAEHDLVIEGAFDPAEVDAVEMRLTGWMIQMQHLFTPVALPPGASRTFRSAWRIGRR